MPIVIGGGDGRMGWRVDSGLTASGIDQSSTMTASRDAFEAFRQAMPGSLPAPQVVSRLGAERSNGPAGGVPPKMRERFDKDQRQSVGAGSGQGQSPEARSRRAAAPTAIPTNPTSDRSRATVMASSFDQALPDGVEDGLGAVGYAELPVHVADVVADGLVADAEPVGDLLVGETLGQQAKDLHLALREAVI